NVSSISNRSATFTRPIIWFFTAAKPLIGSIASVTRYEQGSAMNDMIRSTSSAENASQKSVTIFMLVRSAGVGAGAAATDAASTIPARPAPEIVRKLRRVVASLPGMSALLFATCVADRLAVSPWRYPCDPTAAAILPLDGQHPNHY